MATWWLVPCRWLVPCLPMVTTQRSCGFLMFKQARRFLVTWSSHLVSRHPRIEQYWLPNRKLPCSEHHQSLVATTYVRNSRFQHHTSTNLHFASKDPKLGFPKMGYPKLDHDSVLKPMVTLGTPILGHIQFWKIRGDWFSSTIHSQFIHMELSQHRDTAKWSTSWMTMTQYWNQRWLQNPHDVGSPHMAVCQNLVPL